MTALLMRNLELPVRGVSRTALEDTFSDARTGNASPDAPHLHFAIFRLGPERQWWKGAPINPFPILAQRSTNN